MGLGVGSETTLYEEPSLDDLFIFDKSGKNGTKNGNRVMPFLFDPTTSSFKYAPSYIESFPELNDWALLIDYNQDFLNSSEWKLHIDLLYSSESLFNSNI